MTTENGKGLEMIYFGRTVIEQMSHLVGKQTMWFPNRSDTNRSVQSQKRASILKFRIQVEEELYYPSSENKGADQLCSYCEADLRLCFRLGRLLVFPCGGSNYVAKQTEPRHEKTCLLGFLPC